MCFCSVENLVQARLSTLNVSFSILQQSQCLQTRKRRRILKWRWARHDFWQAVQLVESGIVLQRGVGVRFTCLLFDRGLWRIKSSRPTLCWKLSGTPRRWGMTTPLALWVSLRDFILIWFTKNLFSAESKMFLLCSTGQIHPNTLWHNW